MTFCRGLNLKDAWQHGIQSILRRTSLLLLLLILAGCSKSNDHGSSAQPAPGAAGAAALKKDPGIEAALYALQTIDYEEGFVEKPSAMHKVTDLNDYVLSAINKIPAADMKLQDELRALDRRVLDLGIDQIMERDTFKDHVESYHIVRNELLDEIKKLAASRNAPAELPPVDQLEVAHPQGAKWRRGELDRDIFYDLPAKNSITVKNALHNKEAEERPELQIVCGKDFSISVHTDVQTPQVSVKFDGGAPVKETWIATNLDVVTPHPGPLFRRFLKARTFSIELTPRHERQQTIVFDLADFKEKPGEDRDCKF